MRAARAACPRRNAAVVFLVRPPRSAVPRAARTAGVPSTIATSPWTPSSAPSFSTASKAQRTSTRRPGASSRPPRTTPLVEAPTGGGLVARVAEGGRGRGDSALGDRARRRRSSSSTAPGAHGGGRAQLGGGEVVVRGRPRAADRPARSSAGRKRPKAWSETVAITCTARARRRSPPSSSSRAATTSPLESGMAARGAVRGTRAGARAWPAALARHGWDRDLPKASARFSRTPSWRRCSTR